MLRAILRPLNRRFDRQLRGHVEELLVPRLDQVSGQVEDVRLLTSEVRRVLTDDLDASTEVAALLGRQLAIVSDAVADLRAEVAELRQRMDRS